MKKSNIFMISYVAFLFFILGIKIFFDFQIFDKVLLATTISSFFFAWGDFISYTYDCYRDIYNFEIEIVSTYKRRNKDHKNNLPAKISDLEKRIPKDEKSIKNYSILCNICFGFGFFCFLAIITFYETEHSLIQAFVKTQDVLTLAAFAFSSLMYLIKEIFDKYFERFGNSLDLINILEAIEKGEKNNGQDENALDE